MSRRVDGPPSWGIFSPAKWRSLAEESTRGTNIPEHGVKLPAVGAFLLAMGIGSGTLCRHWFCVRAFLRSPLRKFRTPGSARGAPSNRCRYLNRQKKKMRFTEKHIP